MGYGGLGVATGPRMFLPDSIPTTRLGPHALLIAMHATSMDMR